MAENSVSRLVDGQDIPDPAQIVVQDGEGITAPQQYALNEIYLILNDGSAFDLKPALLEMSIHEDLFSPAISGYVMIVDTSGLIETLNITGFNFIQINFGKVNPDDDPSPYNRTFRVYKIGERFQQTRQQEQYALYFCSEELILNEQIKIAKAFTDTTIDQIVFNILTNSDADNQGLQITDAKMGIIEQTKGNYNFIVPNLKPFEAINWLSTYAQPLEIQNQSADMLFFENKQGYNFRSLQSMIGDNAYASYNYSPQSISETNKDLNYNLSAILSYRFVRTFDALKIINGGGYANKIVTIDPLLRTSKSVVFNYDNYFLDNITLNNSSITSGYKNRFGQKVSEASESVFKVAVGNADETTNQSVLDALEGNGYVDKNSHIADLSSITYDIGIETFVPYRTAQLTLINHTKIEFLVPGDPSLSVGSVVILNIPSYSNVDNSKETSLDAYYASKYLVTAVRHKMDVTGVYQCLVEAVTDSVATDYIDSGGIISEVNQA